MLRPWTTASRTTERSCSSRIRSAAARATSAAPSTEIPTSAACNAGASLMPSPMKPTTWPSRFSASRIRCFCCGLTRQNRLTRGNCPISASSMSCVSASPVSTPVTGTPISAKTWRATSSLSPVSTLTEIPAAAIAWIVAPALAFGGSRKTAKPEKTRSLSSAIAAVCVARVDTAARDAERAESLRTERVKGCLEGAARLGVERLLLSVRRPRIARRAAGYPRARP